ncbi:MAG: hypothetical protein KDD75_08795 [Caldilineaceae bacterium]|nr:hypothetical protein [Caldilineaceae bacterium]
MSVATIRTMVTGWWLPGSARTQSIEAQRATDEASAARYAQALHGAWQRFTRTYPAWKSRGVDERFVHGAVAPLLRKRFDMRQDDRRAPCGMDVAAVWARQFGLLYSSAERVQLTAELAAAAGDLLRWLDEGR